jgi:chromate transporter
MDRPVTALALHLVFLSVVAVGGFITVVPELNRFVVDVHGWMTDETFVTLFALAQAAPGPNMIVVTLVGWEVAGAAGAVAATAATCLPTLLLASVATKVWSRYNRASWYKTFERGIAPFAIGLVLATGFILTAGAAVEWRSYALTAATAMFMLATRRSPLIPLGLAAVLGFTGVV